MAGMVVGCLDDVLGLPNAFSARGCQGGKGAV